MISKQASPSVALAEREHSTSVAFLASQPILIGIAAFDNRCAVGAFSAAEGLKNISPDLGKSRSPRLAGLSAAVERNYPTDVN